MKIVNFPGKEQETPKGPTVDEVLEVISKQDYDDLVAIGIVYQDGLAYFDLKLSTDLDVPTAYWLMAQIQNFIMNGDI